MEQLSGGDRRALRGARAVADLAAVQPALLPDLVSLLAHDDPRIAMRAADALEKATRHRRAALRAHTRILLGLAAATPHQEVRWHLAQMLPSVVSTIHQRRKLRAILTGYLGDRSAIVRTMAMQGLYELAVAVPIWRRAVRSRLEAAARDGTPAMKARGRMLLDVFDGP